MYSIPQRCEDVGLSAHWLQEHPLRKRLSETSPMVRRLPLTLARNTLGQVVKRIHADKEYVILERDGVAMAAIIDIDEFEDYLESRDPEVAAVIAESQQDYQKGRSRPASDLLAELEGER
jgi:PHD/YefM family antitoxin component YafN of YafNO toxin-antitoxin module